MNDTCMYTDMEHNLLIWYLRILGLFSTPACLFVIYLILRHSPKNAGTYRCYLLCYALAGCSLDIYFTVMANPVLFLPLMTGYIRGLMQYFPEAATATTYYFFYNLGVLLVSSVMLPMYQFRAMLPPHIVSCWTKKTNVVINIVVVLLMTFIFVYSVIKDKGFFQISEIRRASVLFPCLIPMFSHTTAVYFDILFIEDGILSYIVISSLFAIFCAIGSILTVVTLNKITKPTSAKTAAMHKRFLTRLLLQVAIPYTLVILPFMMYAYMVKFKPTVTFEYFGDIFVGLISTHGLVASVAILVANEHYFKLIKGSNPVSFNRIELSTISTNIE